MRRTPTKGTTVARTDRRLSRWLRVTGLVYALGAIDYVARPQAALDTLGRIGGDELAPETNGLYNSLAGAYMATIAALALGASTDPASRRDLIPPLLVGKAASATALLYMYARTRKKGYAVGAGVDAFLLGVTAGLTAALDD